MTTNLAKPALEINGSRLFANWLASTGASLVLSTYQAGKIFMIGTKPDGSLSVFERTFERSMGLGVGDGRLWASTLYQMWRFENFLDPGTSKDGYDAMFVPVAGHTTGDIDVHDIHVGGDGAPLFVATRFNCLATLSDRGSFKSVWRPPFIDRLAAEDRCHLNGLTVEDGAPAYVTCVGKSNIAEGWRPHRAGGGLVIYVPTTEILSTGLSMPHSPRLYRDKLWLLQAGTGEFGVVDEDTGKFEATTFLPGFARGLAFIGDYAVIGLSSPRENRTFSGLPLDDRLTRDAIEPQTAICIVNLATGDLEHRLNFDGVISELYDVQVLPGIKRPMLHGFKTDDIRFQIKPEEIEQNTRANDRRYH